MIDWIKTFAIFGHDRPKYRKRLCVYCDQCFVAGIVSDGTIILTRVADVVDGQLYWECKKCVTIRTTAATIKACNTSEHKAAVAIRSKKLWENDEYRRAVIANRPPCDTEKMSEIMKKVWADPIKKQHHTEAMKRLEVSDKLCVSTTRLWKCSIYRQRMIELFKIRGKKLWEDADYRQRIIKALTGNPKSIAAGKRLWQNPVFAAKMVALHKALWKDDNYRQKMMKIWFNRSGALSPRASSIQLVLYSILDDLGIKYYREYTDKAPDIECLVGPYIFDCVIPTTSKILLIECQGNYWHTLDKAFKRDISKQSYIVNNLSTQYELKCLWEHEFLNKDRIINTIKYWLKIDKPQLIGFSFAELTIKPAPAIDYRLLLSKYHYLPTAPFGSQAYGAYLNNILIAVATFSAVRRQNMEASIGYENDSVRELSRFCIHPSYQQSNFGSWFLSRCIKLLPHKYQCIITYADTTFNHTGALYLACNFKSDKTVPPDYWYVAQDGWVMHKRTLYGHARNLKLTEAEFATTRGYRKVYGSTKTRYKFIRS